MNQTYACLVADVLGGEALRIDTSPATALFNISGESYAIDDRCSRDNVSIPERYLEDDVTMEYPLHAVGFRLRTGEVLCLPATDSPTTYPAYVEDGNTFIDLPEV